MAGKEKDETQQMVLILKGFRHSIEDELDPEAVGYALATLYLSLLDDK